MSITINSNILSLNAQRRVSDHTKNLRSSFEKLSSGLRVSKASDDAAGLAISENLKTDSRLSSQALRNVNDGISMISFISGALDSQKVILYRMGEIAEQSANGVNTGQQRVALQKEYLSLQEEFDRVATSAKFNGISLLRNADPNSISIMAGITGADSSLLTVAAANSHRFAGEHTLISDIDQSGGVTISDVLALNNLIKGVTSEEAQNANKYHGIAQSTVKANDGRDVIITFAISRVDADRGKFAATGPTPATINIFFNASDANNSTDSFNTVSALSSSATTATISGNLSSSGASFSLNLDLSGISYSSLEDPAVTSRQSNIGLTSVLYKQQARIALDTVRNRIDDLSKIQGSFGAIESRLTFAANRLLIDRENFQSAASQITDADVTIEAATLAKTQILQQAATSILAQANQQPQIALQLLGGL